MADAQAADRPRFDARGWSRAKPGSTPIGRASRNEEEPTNNAPADYALWLDGHIAGVVEAKKLTVGPQNVLTQAARYSQGIEGGPYNFDGHRAPFLYSTNGEVTWFHDVRHPSKRSRHVADFRPPDSLRELLAHDIDAAIGRSTARDYFALPTVMKTCWKRSRDHVPVASS